MKTLASSGGLARRDIQEMIVLDTDVLSALMQREPDPIAIAWLDGQPSESI